MPIGRNGGRSRWKLPFGRSSSAAASSPAASVRIGSTPMSFLCPISSSLMADPVIIPTGHTFERACIEACREFNFTPPSLITTPSSNIDDYFSSSSPSLIPNAALRAAIFDWCDHAALPRPSPVSRETARALVQNLISNSKSPPPPKFQQQIAVEIEMEEEEEEDYATKNKNNQQQQRRQFSSPPTNSSSGSTCSTSSFFSSEKDQNHLPPAAAAAIHSSSASSSNNITSSSSSSDPLEESILIKLKSPQISVKESGLITLRQSARESSDSRISLCTPRILAALVPMILVSSSSNNNSSTNATAALVNLSIEPANKVKIVRSGAIPPLVEALKKKKKKSGRYCEEARYNAAGALFSLSLEDENKLAIGVLGAIPPLIDLFCQESAGPVARVEAGMALYHLSLAPNNLSKIAKTPGAVKAILNMAVAATAAAKEEGESESSEETASRMLCLRLRRVGMMVLASLARRDEGRVALMDADAVKAITVGLMMESAAAGREEEEYCLAVMYEMSKGKGSLRFRALARAAGAERVLLLRGNDDDARGEVGREMVRRILKVIRGDHEERGVNYNVVGVGEEEEEEEEVASVVSDGLVSFRRRRRRYDDFGGTSATNSANF